MINSDQIYLGDIQILEYITSSKLRVRILFSAGLTIHTAIGAVRFSNQEIINPNLFIDVGPMRYIKNWLISNIDDHVWTFEILKAMGEIRNSRYNKFLNADNIRCTIETDNKFKPPLISNSLFSDVLKLKSEILYILEYRK